MDKAIEWYEKAYEMHEGDAGYAAAQISDIYEDLGNQEKKLEWEEKSAKEGFAGAMIRMGLRYDGEDASPADREKAIAWYRKAYEAQGGAAESAALFLAMAYDNQGQVDQAVEWYQKVIGFHGTNEKWAKEMMAECLKRHGLNQ